MASNKIWKEKLSKKYVSLSLVVTSSTIFYLIFFLLASQGSLQHASDHPIFSRMSQNSLVEMARIHELFVPTAQQIWKDNRSDAVIDNSQKDFSYQQTIDMLKIFGSLITSLDLNFVDNQNDKKVNKSELAHDEYRILIAISKHCRKLAELKWRNSLIKGPLFVRANRQLLKMFHKLKSLSLPDCQFDFNMILRATKCLEILSLTLTASNKIEAVNLPHLQIFYMEIVEYPLDRKVIDELNKLFNINPQLKYVQIFDEFRNSNWLSPIVKHTPDIEAFSYRFENDDLSVFDDDEIKLITSLKQLEFLNVNFHAVTDNQLLLIGEHLKELTELQINGSDLQDMESFYVFLGTAKNLQTLHVHQWTILVDDFAYKRIVEALKSRKNPKPLKMVCIHSDRRYWPVSKRMREKNAHIYDQSFEHIGNIMELHGEFVFDEQKKRFFYSKND